MTGSPSRWSRGTSNTSAPESTDQVTPASGTSTLSKAETTRSSSDVGPTKEKWRRKPITDSVAPGEPVPGTKAFRITPGRAIAASKATIEIAGETMETEVPEGASSVQFDLKLPKGKTELVARFLGDDGEITGAYYAYVKKLP